MSYSDTETDTETDSTYYTEEMTDTESDSSIVICDTDTENEEDLTITGMVSGLQSLIINIGEIQEEIHEITSLNYPEDDELEDGYYIGMYSNHNGMLLLRNKVSSRAFFRYSIDCIRQYLINWSVFPPVDNENNNIEIMKLIKTPTTTSSQYYYTVKPITQETIIKIQKVWKKIIEVRKKIIEKRRNIHNLHTRTIMGSWPEGLNYWPILKGCLNYPNVFDIDMLYRY
jgi:hypothetical protein